MTNPDPWLALSKNWPKVAVYIRVLPDRWGQTVWDGDRPFIELAHDLGATQQRCTLAHELHHLEMGKPCTSFCGNNERDVVEATARWLLPEIEPIGAVLREFDIQAAAQRLDVTRQVLNDRLHCMTEAELHALERMLNGGAAGAEVRAADGPRRTAGTPHQCRPPAPGKPSRRQPR